MVIAYGIDRTVAHQLASATIEYRKRSRFILCNSNSNVVSIDVAPDKCALWSVPVSYKGCVTTSDGIKASINVQNGLPDNMVLCEVGTCAAFIQQRSTSLLGPLVLSMRLREGGWVTICHLDRQSPNLIEFFKSRLGFGYVSLGKCLNNLPDSILKDHAYRVAFVCCILVYDMIYCRELVKTTTPP